MLKGQSSRAPTEGFAPAHSHQSRRVRRRLLARLRDHLLVVSSKAPVIGEATNLRALGKRAEESLRIVTGRHVHTQGREEVGNDNTMAEYLPTNIKGNSLKNRRFGIFPVCTWTR